MTETCIFIGSDKIGEGDPNLGEILMRAAIKTIGKLEPTPSTILFMNAGVKLCCEGSNSLEALKELEAQGLKLLCCGTCLDFFHLKESLAVGEVSNMLEILSAQNNAAKVIRL